jgi:hypothetical protein
VSRRNIGTPERREAFEVITRREKTQVFYETNLHVRGADRQQQPVRGFPTMSTVLYQTETMGSSARRLFGWDFVYKNESK